MPIRRWKDKFDVEKLVSVEPCPNCGASKDYVIRTTVCDGCNNNRFVYGGVAYARDPNCDGLCQEVYLSSRSYSQKLKCMKCSHTWTVTRRIL